ncbi:amidoligase family protein [Candidatus Saccharibacteria bacterium]|nr:amidoligase family protein [Candidatus Saccharibacteria bacterium]
MLSSKFGIEVEMTGITRKAAADVAAKLMGGTISICGDYYDTYTVTTPDGRTWNFMYDSSIDDQKLMNGKRCNIDDLAYSVEMVSPILTYREDIDTLQKLLRKLKKAGAFTNGSCGIHIHLDGAPHTPRSLRNFINLVASRNDLFYKALQIGEERKSYCKKMDEYLVKKMNKEKPKTFADMERIWYSGFSQNPETHYHRSRYSFLNLHCFFHGNHTVELRGFNSTLHAGKVRAYIVFALAMNHQALTQRSAQYRKVQNENEKFAMRVYLVRIGLSGEEFQSCRKHLYEHLSGNAAWRYGSKENCKYRRRNTHDLECGSGDHGVETETDEGGHEGDEIAWFPQRCDSEDQGR